MTEMLFYEEMMLQALVQARLAADLGEVPVGAVVTDKSGGIIAVGYNSREALRSPMAHAEIIAIEKAAKVLGSRRLTGCTLYVTLEPCPMCAGAIAAARLKRVVFGAYDGRGGAVTSLISLYDFPLEYTPMWRGGILETECAAILKDFFEKKR